MRGHYPARVPASLGVLYSPTRMSLSKEIYEDRSNSGQGRPLVELT